MPVPELVLKHRRKVQRDIRSAAERATEKEKRAALVKEHAIKSAQVYARYYIDLVESEKKARENALRNNQLYVPDEPKVYLIVRIRGIVGVAPKVRTILSLLRLRQINNAVFMRCNKATLNALRIVDHYVTYGEPTVETIRNLIYKRGFAKVNGQRIPIVDNNLIDEQLSKHNILCAEDLVHEIFTCGSSFKEANNFLWPFQLNSAALKDKRNNFAEGGDFGYRGKYINEFVARMI